MKTLKIFGIILLSAFTIFSCDEVEYAVDGSEGGLLEIQNSSINYIVGNTGPYSCNFITYQGEVKTTKVEVYKSFHSGGESSDRVLFKTIDISDVSKNTFHSFDFTFDDLIADLTFNGAPLPESDGQFNIGDRWQFDFEATFNGGKSLQNRSTNVIVATRFAGRYSCIEGEYYRLGELTYTSGDWPSETVIQSVDATTYRVLEYFGPFNGNEFYFTIDPATNEISYPANTPEGDPQLGNGNPMTTCENNAGDLSNVNCGNSNFAVKMDDGKDLLYMTFGYYTAGSGPREFYQVLQKIVE